MVTGQTTKAELRSRFVGPRISPSSSVADRDHPVLAWVILVGIFSPSAPIPVGDLTFTVGRFAVLLLYVPAVAVLFQKGRTRVASDYFAFAAAFWILFASAFNDGFRPYVAAEALEFSGAYVIGRAFFFGRPALETFVRVFKVVTIVVIMLALLDTLSGRVVTQEWIGRTIVPGRRFELIRAYSVFDGAELYGTFCVAAAAIFLHSESSWFRRILWLGIAMFGVVLSLSSGPLLGLFMVLPAYAYGRIMKTKPWRWKALVTGAALLLTLLFIFADNPIGWLIRNLTLDPWTGYWRVAEWDHALAELSKSPLLGFGLSDWKGVSRDFMIFVGEQGVDCVWLVEALRYGYPMVLLLGLTLFMPFFARSVYARNDGYMDDMRTGFSLVVIVLSIIGLTVHYWDSVWVFFSLCMGIRASFVEFESRRRDMSSTQALGRGAALAVRRSGSARTR